MAVCGAFLTFYLLFRCFKKYQKQNLEKTTAELHERYFNYDGKTREANLGQILPTFCPHSDSTNQPGSLPIEHAH